MRLATRRLHVLDNVAPLTFPVCGVCEKAIMAKPYEVDGKSYHAGDCLIELGHRVTEEIWRAKEAARIAAEERSRSLEALVGEKAARPNITYLPIITTVTDGTTTYPYYGGTGGTAGGNINGGANVVTFDSNTILLPANLVASANSALYSRGSAAAAITEWGVTTTTAAYNMDLDVDWHSPVVMTAVSGL